MWHCNAPCSRTLPTARPTPPSRLSHAVGPSDCRLIGPNRGLRSFPNQREVLSRGPKATLLHSKVLKLFPVPSFGVLVTTRVAPSATGDASLPALRTNSKIGGILRQEFKFVQERKDLVEGQIRKMSSRRREIWIKLSLWGEGMTAINIKCV